LLDELAGQDRADDMRQTLEILGGLLEVHFRREAGKDGLFEVIRRIRPECHRRLLALEDEHATLLGKLKELCTALAASDRADAELRRAKADLVAGLRAHEQSENQLMLDAHCVDLGDSG
jgi:hypothetical protein